jgi:hypothetical protein
LTDELEDDPKSLNRLEHTADPNERRASIVMPDDGDPARADVKPLGGQNTSTFEIGQGKVRARRI